MNHVINLIGWACLTILFVHSEPTIRLRDEIIFKNNKDNWMYRLVSCCMCSGFHIYLWSNLLLTHNFDILSASIVSILSILIEKKLFNSL